MVLLASPLRMYNASIRNVHQFQDVQLILHIIRKRDKNSRQYNHFKTLT